MNKLKITSGSHFGKNELTEFQNFCANSASIYQDQSNYSKRTVIGGYLNGEFISPTASFKFRREDNETYLSKGIALYDGKLVYNPADKLVELSETDNTVYSISPLQTYALEGTLSIDALGEVVGFGTKFTKYFRAGNYANYLQISDTSEGLQSDSTLAKVFRVLEVTSDTSMRVFVTNDETLNYKFYTAVSCFGNTAIPTSPSRFTYVQEGFLLTPSYTGLPIYQKANGYYYDSRMLVNETYKTPFESSKTLTALPILDIEDVKVSPKGSELSLYSLKLSLRKQCSITASNGSLEYLVGDNTYFDSLSGAILKDEFGFYSKPTGDLPNQLISCATGITGGLLDVSKTFTLEHASEWIYLRACDLSQSITNIPVYFSKVVNTNATSFWIELPTNTPNISIQLSNDGNTWITIDFDVDLIVKNCINADESYIASGTALPIVAGKVVNGIKQKETLPIYNAIVPNELVLPLNVSEVDYYLKNNYSAPGGTATFYENLTIGLLSDFSQISNVFNVVGYSNTISFSLFGDYEAFIGLSGGSYYQFDSILSRVYDYKTSVTVDVCSGTINYVDKSVTGIGGIISEAVSRYDSRFKITLSFADNGDGVYSYVVETFGKYHRGQIIQSSAGLVDPTHPSTMAVGIRYCDGTNGTPAIADIGTVKHYMKMY